MAGLGCSPSRPRPKKKKKFRYKCTQTEYQNGSGILRIEIGGKQQNHINFSNSTNFNRSKKIFNEITTNCYKIATNKSGCCVLPLSVESCNGEAKQRLITQIILNALHLAEDRYGISTQVSGPLGEGFHLILMCLL